MANVKEAVLALHDVSDDAPPPYSQVATAGPSTPSSALNPASSNSASGIPDLKPLVRSCDSSPYLSLRPTLTAHYQWKMTRTYHLGNGDNQKMFAISNYAGLTGRGPDRAGVVMFNGPSEKDPVLAAAGETLNPLDAHALESVINLSILPGREVSLEKDDEGVATELLRAGLMGDQKTVVFRFSIEVSHELGKGRETAMDLPREEFEWRMTNKEEMGEKEHSHEFKLFRLERPASQGDGKDSAVSLAKDGSEPVAVASWKRLMALSKPFNIEFIGSGIKDLGDRWAAMAVITALRIWFLDQSGRATSSFIASSIRRKGGM
ncbi:hypothetical protein G7Z17_g2046 [Cylindrodendrum hubeiense]|uniref:Uncharacterized protein n=1 Tax=Cylindrodendrum hubeiense TaxID=595255 RepID=A0A9P5LBY7_9HYPO|nr:hypothetical protein G7Z17_g2046 [Cylindrodendrum hubeiense]